MNNLLSMLLYIGVTILTAVFAYKVTALRVECCEAGSRKSYINKLYITGIFVVLFLLSAIRFDVGNDYEQYTKTAHEAFVGGYVVTEPGFNWLVRLVYTALGEEYYGGSIPDIIDLIGSMGVGPVSYDYKTGTFTNNITDPRVVKACQYYAELQKEGLLVNQEKFSREKWD